MKTQKRDSRGRFLPAVQTAGKRDKITGHVTEYDRYEIVRAGQEKPHIGNRVCAELTLFLPHPLPPAIVFHSTCDDVAGESLHDHWGYKVTKEDCRCRRASFAATTWSEAFRLAEKYAITELTKLKTAIETREQALIDAEK